MKLRELIATVLLTLTLCSGCGVQNPEKSLPDPSVVQKDNANITSFDFYKNDECVNNVVSEFKRGLFDDQGFSLLVTYSDTTTKRIPLTMRKIPNEYRKLLNVVGMHTVNVLYRGVEKYISFNVLQSDVKNVIRYFTFDGQLIKSISVEPGEKITDQIPDVPDRPDDTRFIYDGERRWIPDLTDEELGFDQDVYPDYDPTYKRFHGETPVPLEVIGEGAKDWKQRLLYDKVDDDVHTSYFHLGRIHRVNLLRSSNVIYHEQNTQEDMVSSGNLSINPSEIASFAKNIYTGGVTVFPYSADSGFNSGEQLVNPDNSTYVTSLDHTIEEELDGHTKTKLTKDGPKVELYTTLLGDIASEFTPEDPYKFDGYVSIASQSGYYTVAIQANIDVILKMRFRKATKDYSYRSADLLELSVIVTVDYDSLEAVVDYHKDSSSFPSTKITEFNKFMAYDDVYNILYEGYEED